MVKVKGLTAKLIKEDITKDIDHLRQQHNEPGI